MKIQALAALAALASTSVAAATAPVQFDLACSGVLKRHTGETSQWTKHVVVDLAVRAWCEDACPTVFPIARINSGEIVFEDTRGMGGGGASEHRFSVSRTDWAVTYDVVFNGAAVPGESPAQAQAAVVSDTVSGSCKVTPFTPFPKPQL